MKLVPAFAALALLFGVSQAGATVYNINGTNVGTGSVTGTIQTDGVTGVLATGNITDWNLIITTDPSHSFNLLGPLSGNNSERLVVGTALTATATGLFFDFSSDPAANYVLIQNPFILSGTNFVCLNGCSASVDIGVGDFRASTTLTGVQEIGSTTPLPAALPLFVSGAGVIGLVARRRKRKAA